MRCLSCNSNLTDREASRKYENWREITDPEARYIMLCEVCCSDAGLAGVENPLASDERFQDDTEPEIDEGSDVEDL